MYGYKEIPRELAKEGHRIRNKINRNEPLKGSEKNFIQVAKKTSFSLRHIETLFHIVSIPEDILNKETQKKEEDKLDFISLSRLGTIDDEKLLRKVYKYLEEKRPSSTEASKLVSEIKHSSEQVIEYILGAEKVDLEEITKLRKTFTEEEEQARVIKIMESGKAESISEAIRMVEVEKGERDDYEEFTIKVRIYKNGEIVNEGYSDNKIVDKFHTREKRRLPIASNEVVCPSFTELKWARGCPFNCAWCYLQGTLRHMEEGKKPYVYDYKEIEMRVIPHLKWSDPQIFVTGEIADSLMHENANPPFSQFIINLFKKYGNGHKVLFLSKNNKVDKLIEAQGQDVAIISFTLNAYPIAERWEKAPHPRDRLEAASKVYSAGYETRIRIDPMVPILGWEEYYKDLVDLIFKKLEPERITLGSLRGLQSTINQAEDKSWVVFLTEKTEWGKKIGFRLRKTMYETLIDYIRGYGYKGHIALCKETLGMWTKMGMDYSNCRCNCVW